MIREHLEQATRKKLAEMARDQGVAGWHGMKKEELIQALISQSSKKRVHTSITVKTPVPPVTSAKTPEPAAASRKPIASRASVEPANGIKPPIQNGNHPLPTRKSKELPVTGRAKDRIVVMVRDPYWLHCYWELTQPALQRAEAALNQDWPTANPILRLLDVTTQDTTSISESIVRDIPIHGGCNNWYIDVANPPRSYRVDIGYLAKSGSFYVLARSNVVSTPRPGTSDAIDENWSDIDPDKADRIHAMSVGFNPSGASQEIKQLFNERLRRPLGSPSITSFGAGNLMFGRTRKFNFQLDAELIIYGSTDPHARLTLQGEPVKLRPDGTFTLRFCLPEGRQIIPSVAVSPDGVEERTIILAIERNTKSLEPLIHDGND